MHYTSLMYSLRARVHRWSLIHGKKKVSPSKGKKKKKDAIDSIISPEEIEWGLGLVIVTQSEQFYCMGYSFS